MNVMRVFQKFDERQEALAVEAVLIEIVRRTVRGRDDDDITGEKVFEQTTDQRGIGDVFDLKLVKAEEFGAGSKFLGCRWDRVVYAALNCPARSAAL